MRHDRTTLLDLVLAARSIRELSAGLDRDRFVADRRVHLAILHELIVLGEAAKRLSPAARSKARDVPWRRLGGMRDKLVHGYDPANLDRVWVTVERDVPRLETDFARLLGEHDDRRRSGRRGGESAGEAAT